MALTFRHPVTIYYEDTDFSGFVYHANYLKYFERGREELLGVEALAEMYRETGVGFVVYKAELQFKEPAFHGDRLEVRTTVSTESEYRAIFDQSAWRGDRLLVSGKLQLVCVDKAGKLVPLPSHVMKAIVEQAEQ